MIEELTKYCRDSKHWNKKEVPLDIFEKRLHDVIGTSLSSKEELVFENINNRDKYRTVTSKVAFENGFALLAKIKSSVEFEFNDYGHHNVDTINLGRERIQIQKKSQIIRSVVFNSTPRSLDLELVTNKGECRLILTEFHFNYSDNVITNPHLYFLSDGNAHEFFQRSKDSIIPCSDIARTCGMRYDFTRPLQALVGMRALYTELIDKSRKPIAYNCNA